MIELLPLLDPDQARADRTRARCRQRFARRFQPRVDKHFVIERAVFVGFGAIYLSSLAFDVVRMLTS